MWILIVVVALQQLEMVEPSGWIHISLLNQVLNDISDQEVNTVCFMSWSFIQGHKLFHCCFFIDTSMNSHVHERWLKVARKVVMFKHNWFLSVYMSAYQRANQHLHDPDRGVGQPSERKRHSYETDKSLHTRGREFHWKVPTMHHGRLHDVPHHPVTWAVVWHDIWSHETPSREKNVGLMIPADWSNNQFNKVLSMFVS